MKTIIAYVLGPAVGTVAYTIASFLRSILLGEPESEFAEIASFAFSLLASFVAMAIFTEWLSPDKKGPYIVSSVLFFVLTLIGMISAATFTLYFYIVLVLVGVGSMRFIGENLLANKNI